MTPSRRALARRRAISWLIGIGGTLFVAALVAAGIYRMYGPGELGERLDRLVQRWRPFFDPSIAGGTWSFIWKGLVITLQSAVISIALSLLFGVILALMRLSRHSPLRLPATGLVRAAVSIPSTVLIQTVRSAPLFLLVLYSFLALPKLGLNLDAFWAGIAALTLYTSCVLAEIVRAGILSLDRGQFEAAEALGLRYLKKLRFVVMPQALRRMAPAIVAQLVTLIKDTSLLNFITVIELSRRLVILQQIYFNPIESFIVAGLIYFLVNLALSILARRMERRPARVGPAAKAELQGIGEEDQTLVASGPRG
ncbi:MAG: amino acid ABC transporter permease [Actinomycetota bacterium]|nr:amino acid ABC transporter permease [Actinomycetota bacterium]